MSAQGAASETGPDAAAATLLSELQSGQRRALARVLSLAESHKPAHRVLLDALWQLAGGPPSHTLRVAFTGPPGAGKSSLIERVGMALAGGGARLAVLPIDPSSQVSGGSLLADQTRMTQLSRHPAVFIRPSAAGATLGGLAAHTQESIELCELAGYDWVLLETVGVGQNEVEVARLADVVLLVLTADAGDELQALKRGVNEICHAVVVNKAEAERCDAAQALAHAYVDTAHLWLGDSNTAQPSPPQPLRSFVTSALDGSGVDELVSWLQQQRQPNAEVHSLRAEVRAAQRLAQMQGGLGSLLLAETLKHPELAALHAKLQSELAAGSVSVRGAQQSFLATFAAVLATTRT